MNIKGLLVATVIGATPLLVAGVAAADTGLLGQPAPAAQAGGPAISASPASVSPTDSGDVSFTVTGARLPSNMMLSVNSNGLTAACTGGTTLKGKMVKADRNGRFNLSASGMGCLAGTYTIEATEAQTPYQTYTTTLTIADEK